MFSQTEHSVSYPTESNKSITILYGSQTGNARALAELLTLQAYRIFDQECVKSNLECLPTIHLLSMNDYAPVSRLVKEKGVVIFVCSTTGHGVPPDNMLRFWKKIMSRALIPGRSLPADLRFAVLGLGDSSYPMFNFVAKKLYRRLIQLGATPILSQVNSSQECEENANSALGLADEQSELGTNGVLRSWVPNLWHNVLELLGVPISERLSTFISWCNMKDPNFVFSLWPKYDITCCSLIPKPSLQSASGQSLLDRIVKQVESDNTHSFMSNPVPHKAQWFQVVCSNRVTSSDHFQDTRLLELTCKSHVDSNPGEFRPGHVLYVQPTNRKEDILYLFQITGLDPSERVKITQRHSNFPLPSLLEELKENQCDVSIAWLATYYFDLNATPQQYFIINYCAFAVNSLKHSESSTMQHIDIDRLQLEVDRLTDLALAETSDAIDDLYDYIFRPRRRVVEILAEFPVTSSLLSSQNIFDILPGPIRARPYSIASPPPTIALLVAVVNYRTRLSAPRIGTASNYLASLDTGDCLSGWFDTVSGGFNFDRLLTLPPPSCLLIATGTGIAPFHSFLLYQRTSLLPYLDRANYPTNVLFFGCRYSTKDYYFASDFQMLEQEGWLTIIPAFSRENVSGTAPSRRQYVQDQLAEYPEIVWSILKSPQSHVFIVGNQKAMPNEVRKALVCAVVSENHMDTNSAELLISQMETDNRIQIESWT
ncbi:NADPH-dependent diflavin oxidoreductase 1 [Schistosoma japonicum]|nr:NADPH-dependent diflavin oxidoreductase 1 [Schistosoma japonicum]